MANNLPVISNLPFPVGNVTPERCLYVYNQYIDESEDVANYYKRKRGLPSLNILKLNIVFDMSADTPISKSDYINHIENPLIAALASRTSGSIGSGAETPYVIILGYGMPLAYIDSDSDNEIIAIASKLHRIGHSDSNKYSNHTYDRRDSYFHFFDSSDSSELFITAVLDGPTSDSVKTLIDRATDVSFQTFVAGSVYLDPYGRKQTTEDLQYQQDILDFSGIATEQLLLPVESTVDIDDASEEPTIAQFKDDSFYWGWYNPTYSKDLFQNHSFKRAFLYNADDVSASNIHYYDNESPFSINGSDNWGNIAINISNGYAACAGAVDEPGSDAFLRPRPFFDALRKGATLGEAFLFSSPFVSWKTVLIGDPLMTVKFPGSVSVVDENAISNTESIFRIKNSIETSLAWAYRQARLLDEIVTHNIMSQNIEEEVFLLNSISYWRDKKDNESQIKSYVGVINGFLNYVSSTTGSNLSSWLTNNGHKISSGMNEVMSVITAPIDSSLIYPTGQWEYRIRYDHQFLTRENVHFLLELSRDIDFNETIFSLSTLDSVSGWEYETEPSEFSSLPDTGFPSSLSGRRVKFISLEENYLRTTELYYIRWKAVNSTNNKLYPISEEWVNDYIIVSR